MLTRWHDDDFDDVVMILGLEFQHFGVASTQDYSILKQQIIKKCDICATEDDTIIIYYIFKKMQGEIQLTI